ncbi:aldose 1-epimerase [Weissella beninensis]|uniref:Galactose mutarotase n=1 Tax=Periweissella beninensis TaxID=504936 RepID=A0ABT0VL21_9LACO|nr:aldose epimerase family protein [Periweissella beninensis]MBM7544935.1 aldose 1-epimerase [Periweissella beninensis]MCM2437170.1 galactose mutarotase [Periweissella beninensis]
MTVTQTDFGQYAGQQVVKYTIENQAGMRLSILNFAGIIQEISVLDDNQRVNLVLSSDDITGFTANGYNINRIIGRTAGRITKGQWYRDGELIKVPANENGHTLHGGPNGLGQQFFMVKIKQPNEITLTHTAYSENDGFPGDLAVEVTYRLDDANRVHITMRGTQSGQPGVFNPTVHTYFNLADPAKTDILQQDLYVNSDGHLAVDETKVPTGEIIENANSVFDLKKQHDLGQILTQMQSETNEGGFDDMFVVPSDLTQVAARVTDQVSQRKINIYSDRNAIVVFTASQLDSSVEGLNRGVGHPYEAVALEAQTLPDSENHDNLGDVDIDVDETKTYHIVYEYQK